MEDLKDYWRTWLWRDSVTRIITINFLVWLAVAVIGIFSPYSHQAVLAHLALPPTFAAVFRWMPWTIATYMFTHVDFLHLLVNMLWFMLFGKLLADFQGSRRMVILYFYGGLAGALGVLVYNSLAHTGAMLIGASCAVLAVTAACALLYPDFRVNLLFLGPVKILWLVVAATILFLVQWASMPATVAHLAGAFVGVAYGYFKKRGTDITVPVSRLIDSLLSRRPVKARPPRRQQGLSETERHEMDRLLQKVGRSGYASLSSNERQRLFDLSQRIKK